MPSQVRIIREKNSAQWDDLVRDVLQRGAFGIEHDYFGITTQARADKVRRAIRTAGGHQGVGRKVYYKECPNPGRCENGGPDCAYHVFYSIFPMDAARTYKAEQAARARS